ncbi:guanine nucleotide exchange factor [Rhizophagus diaphanus]|nr:guanine nucleotide exchange factor [Rhizophagus diaphanus] [Rhizophagus sp. MUCL 43196]
MSSYISLENKSDIENVSSVFTSLLANQVELTNIPLNIKEELISSLLTDLDENGVQQKWNDNVRLLALQTLKILGRDANGCGHLFTDKGFKILLTHTKLQSTEPKSDTLVTQESLTCIANMLLLKESTRDLFDKYKCISSICQFFKDNGISIKTQFLLSRILFLMTVKPQPAVQPLIDNLGIIDILYNYISKHLEQLSLPNSSSKEDINSLPITRVMVLNEQLKLLFNLMMNDPKIERDNLVQGSNNSNKFEKLLLPILNILLKVPKSTPLPLSPPHSHAIHALLNFPIEPYKSLWFPPSSSKKEQYRVCFDLIDMFKSMIYMAVKNDPDKENAAAGGASNNNLDFDEIITPLVVLLRKLADDDDYAKILIKEELLPDNIDRSKPLEKGDSFSARLIGLMTSVMLPHLKDSISELLFILCNQDANLFVHHVGYGNAAGFLLSKNIMMPPSSSNTSHSDKPINPVTGQYCENEPPSLSNMTDEEKEREAEKLFVLFERLKKTGVMDVVNPVEEAIKSGKIQEYKEDEEDDD